MSTQSGLVTAATELRAYAPAADLSIASPASRDASARARPLGSRRDLRTEPGPVRFIIIALAVTFLSVFVVLTHLAIKSYDLVIALTNGGPGRSTELPATFMYSYTFTRNSMGTGAASAVIMLMMIASVRN